MFSSCTQAITYDLAETRQTKHQENKTVFKKNYLPLLAMRLPPAKVNKNSHIIIEFLWNLAYNDSIISSVTINRRGLST